MIFFQSWFQSGNICDLLRHAATVVWTTMIESMNDNISFVFPVSDSAKSENKPEDMTVYTSLGAAVNLTVKFCMNPDTNYDAYWSKGGLLLQDTNVKNTEKRGHIQTTYFISNVTNKQLGSYRVQVINWAIGPDEVIFNVTLKLRGKESKVM